MKTSFIALLFLMASASALGADVPAELATAMDALSRSMMVGGAGCDAYAALLDPAFSRWNRSGDVLDRGALMKGLCEWWNTGARVKEGTSRMVHLAVVDDIAIARIDRSEQFVDGEGKETGSFRGFVTQVWRRSEEGWRLLSVDVSPAGP